MGAQGDRQGRRDVDASHRRRRSTGKSLDSARRENRVTRGSHVSGYITRLIVAHTIASREDIFRGNGAQRSSRVIYDRSLTVATFFTHSNNRLRDQ